MFAHTIVYVILSILAVTAVHAASSPVSKANPEQLEAGQVEKDSTHTL